MPGVKVWLVGAGPGDAGLLTLRGHEVLGRAQVVIFDRLVGQGIFNFIPGEAELIDVGKEGGRHAVPQREIEKILVAKAQQGLRVVRLKGGDPFLFGRGGEEAEALLDAGISFEIVPGVTSAIAAPECAGIPVTHRGLASSLHIITGHSRDGGPAAIDYKALVSVGGTLVFLMGVAAMEEICGRLIDSGLSCDTRVAVIERGSTSAQRVVHSVLAALPREAAAQNIKSPAVVVVGEVAALGEKFDWKKYLSLAGQKILVTRPAEKSGELSGMLRERGAEVIELPCIKTETTAAVLPRRLNYDWLAFTSEAGVRSFFELLKRSNRDIREIGGAKLAAIGKATAKSLEERALRVDLIPRKYDGASFGRALGAAAGSERILLLRAEEGNSEFNEELRRAGAEFDEIAVYRTVYENAKFVPAAIDAALFTSASAVRGFTAACPGTRIATACCIGAQTAEAAERSGLFENIRVADNATLEALIHEAEECAKK